MFNKNNVIFADAYKILVSKTPYKSMAFKMNATKAPTERAIKIQLSVEDGLIWLDKAIAIKPPTLTYEAIKKHIIQSVYSNDDQMAIILNKDRPGHDVYYTKMQEWRDFAKFIAQSVIDKLTEDNKQHE